jgi:ribosomal protein S28E/S33
MYWMRKCISLSLLIGVGCPCAMEGCESGKTKSSLRIAGHVGMVGAVLSGVHCRVEMAGDKIARTLDGPGRKGDTNAL